MMRSIKILFILLCFNSSLFSQSTFIKKLNGITVGGDYMYGIVSYDDNSFILGANPLVKFDSSGRVLWAKQFIGSDNSYSGQHFLRTSDGKIVMDFEGNIIFMDTSGAISQSFKFTTAYGSRMDLNYIDPNKNIFLMGIESDSLGSGVSVLKLDSSGNILWNIVYGVDTLSHFPVAIIQTDDGGYLLLIGYLASFPASRILSIKLDADGNIIRAFTNSWANTNSKNIFKMDSNKYFVPGNGCFMSFDSTGALNWLKQRTSGYWNDGIVGRNGHLYFTGEAWSDTIPNWIVFSGCTYEIDTGGNILNCIRAGDQYTCSMNLIDTLADGGFIMFGGGMNMGIVILKTDSTYWNPCYNYHLNIPDSILPDTSSPITVISRNGNLTFQITSPVLLNANIYDSLICDGILNVPFTSESSNVTVYPNPADQFFEIRSDNVIINVEVYDIRGSKLNSSIAKENLAQINCSDFVPGIYFIFITIEKGLKVLKLIKE